MSPSYDFSAQQPVLQVSQLNAQVRQLLEQQYGQVEVEGEISNLTKASSGHWYFTLKDSQAQLKCAFFKFQAQHCRLDVRHGSQVIAKGKLSLYEGRGDYQLIVQSLRSQGEGELQRAFLALKAELEQQGLFAQEFKRPIPNRIFKVAIITAPGSAALQDMLSILARRNPLIDVEIWPSRVQGQFAEPELLAALAQVEAKSDAQVVILGRGGGSLEDLWAFNSRALAHAIRHCRLPVISAVGHETDYSISDWAADHRAATPSAAAELVSPNIQDWAQRLQPLQQQLQRRFVSRLQQWQLQLGHQQLQLQQFSQWQLTQQQQKLMQLKAALRHPGQHLLQAEQRRQQLDGRLHQAATQLQAKHQQHLQQLSQRLTPRLAVQPWQRDQQRLTLLRQNLQRLGQGQLDQARQSAAQQAGLLHQLSPLATLGRGYAIVYHQQQAISHSQQLRAGDRVQIRLQDGSKDATID